MMPRSVFCAADTLAGPTSFFRIKNSFKFSQITRYLFNKARSKFMDAGNIARSLGNWSWSCYQKPQPFLLLSGAAWFMPSLLLFVFLGFSFQKWESGPLAGSRSEAQSWYYRPWLWSRGCWSFWSILGWPFKGSVVRAGRLTDVYMW